MIYDMELNGIIDDLTYITKSLLFIFPEAF